MFGFRKTKIITGVDPIYKNIDGVQFADPDTRTIIGDFNNEQKKVLLGALINGYPAGAVAYPEIWEVCMKRALLAWGDIYVKEKVSVPIKIRNSDVYEVAMAFSKAFDKRSLLQSGHLDTSCCDGRWDKYSYYEDIQNTMLHLLILDGYGRNLLELSDDPLNINKNDIIYLAAGIQCGFDDTKEYLKKGTLNKKKIIKLCVKNLVRIPHVDEATEIDNKIDAQLKYRQMIYSATDNM